MRQVEGSLLRTDVCAKLGMQANFLFFSSKQKCWKVGGKTNVE